MEGLEEHLSDSRISVFMCNGADDPEREARHVESLLGKRVDGIVVTGRRADPRRRLDVHGSDIPVLYVYSQSDEPDALRPGARRRGRRGARDASISIELGRRRIAHITGPERFEAVRLRRDGYRKALARARARGAERLLPAGRLVGGLGPRGGRKALRRRAATPPDAIFCGNDQIARGVVDALRERGIAVPDAVSVVGFDNWEIVAAATRPPLTTIDMNLKELGREAGRSLIELIDGSDAQRRPAAALQPRRARIVRRGADAEAATARSRLRRRQKDSRCVDTRRSTSPMSASRAISGASGSTRC